MGPKIRSFIITTSFFSVVLSTVLFVVPSFVFAQETPETPVVETFYRGRVQAILHQKQESDYGDQMVTQVVQVRLLSGDGAGQEKEMSYSIRASRAEGKLLSVGERVVVVRSQGPDGPTYNISDVDRTRSVLILVGIFFALVIFLGKRRGLFAILGLAVSMGVIVWWHIPRLLHTDYPLLVTAVTLFAIACASMFLAHGFRQRTVIAWIGTLVTLVVGYGVSAWSVHLTKLFGMGTEEAFYLQYSPAGSIDLRGLLLSGILLGALGVLDDVTTGQTAAVEEIHLANPSLSVGELFRRGFSVGREHISSLVNTLVLAYTGSSLPLLLLFFVYERPFWVILNSEMVMEEVVRTLVGSMALLLAVPLTTMLAAYWFGTSTHPPTHSS